MTLSVVMPALNAAKVLPGTLEAVFAEPDLVHEVLVSDGGSDDGGPAIAASHGCRVLTGPRGRGAQLARGADAASGDWLLFLHADTRLSPGWGEAVRRHAAGSPGKAASFRFMLDDASKAARRLERLVAWRVGALGLPYGDQGLLVSRSLYDAVGGYAPLPLMEDVDLVRRIGRSRLAALETAAVTSAARYRRDGYLRRMARNGLCLGLYAVGVPPRCIARIYG